MKILSQQRQLDFFWDKQDQNDIYKKERKTHPSFLAWVGSSQKIM